MDQKLVHQLAGYRPSPSAEALIKQTPVLLLVGPTGAGKDSVKEELLKTGRYHHIVSHTTRPPRINHGVIEQDGREYHFIDPATAFKMLDEQSFIEAKIYSGHLYGTSAAEIEAAKNEGKTAMTDMEVQGVAEYKNLDPGVRAVFLLPPDFEVWQQRLQRRYGDVVDLPDYRRRLETALTELEQLLKNDYYVPVINDDLATTVKRIEEVVGSADHTTHNEPAARRVAERLAADIKDYLNRTPSA